MTLFCQGKVNWFRCNFARRSKRPVTTCCHLFAYRLLGREAKNSLL